LPCGDIDLVAIERDRDHLWAEALERFGQHAIWWLEDPELIVAAKELQDARFQGDAWDDRIEHWLAFDGVIRRFEAIKDVSIGEVLQGAIGMEPAKWSRADQMRVSSYLKRAGWERYNSRERLRREWRYRRDK
jgi:predicted P-loop ATPase